MCETLIFEEYSDDEEYRFQVYKKRNYYETQVQHKCVYSEEYIPDNTIYYLNIHEYKHISDTLERAVEIGRECIRNMAG